MKVMAKMGADKNEIKEIGGDAMDHSLCSSANILVVIPRYSLLIYSRIRL